MEHENLNNADTPKLGISDVNSSAVRYTKKLDQDWDDDIYMTERKTHKSLVCWM